MTAQQPATSHAADPAGALEPYRTPMEVAWQFDYAIEIEKLRELYSKAKRTQWDAETKLDWSIEVDPSKPIVGEDRFIFLKIPFIQKLSQSQRETFVAHATAQLLSQFLHGEQGALMTAATLTHAVPDYEAKLYGATQTMDEARHVEVYERYIRKLALVYPISPWLKAVIDRTLCADHYVKILIGMNMVVEGLALGAFTNMLRQTTCPLLRQLVRYVLQDESRHVTFGKVYVQETIAGLHPDDREDVAQFAFEVVKEMVDAQGGVDGRGMRKPDPGFVKVCENAGIELQDLIKGLVEAGVGGMVKSELPPGHIHAFRDLMMPALVRVGAVTPRSRELYAAEGIPVWDDARMLEQMEGGPAEDGGADEQVPEAS